jgi:hypothetical protein
MPIGYPTLNWHSPSPNLIFTRPQRGLTQEGEPSPNLIFTRPQRGLTQEGEGTKCRYWFTMTQNISQNGNYSEVFALCTIVPWQL